MHNNIYTRRLLAREGIPAEVIRKHVVEQFDRRWRAMPAQAKQRLWRVEGVHFNRARFLGTGCAWRYAYGVWAELKKGSES